MKLTYHTDPGHGWIEMSWDVFQSLDISESISSYSYMNNNSVFLEEDCDAPAAIKRLKEMGFTVELVESYKENTPIRHYRRYTAQLTGVVNYSSGSCHSVQCLQDTTID